MNCPHLQCNLYWLLVLCSRMFLESYSWIRFQRLARQWWFLLAVNSTYIIHVSRGEALIKHPFLYEARFEFPSTTTQSLLCRTAFGTTCCCLQKKLEAVYRCSASCGLTDVFRCSTTDRHDVMLIDEDEDTTYYTFLKGLVYCNFCLFGGELQGRLLGEWA